jgi:hypothetical protein
MVLAGAGHLLHVERGQIPDLEFEVASISHDGVTRIELKELLVQNMEVLVSAVEEGRCMFGQHWVVIHRTVAQRDAWGALDCKTEV